MKKRGYIVCCVVLAVITGACKKAYEPVAVTTNYDYLVVNGVINTGTNSVTTISLSRTRNLGDTVTISKTETGASVTIESDNGSTYPLSVNGSNYVSAAQSLDISHQYRLRITSGANVYLSDYVTPKQSPPIDSVTWKQDTGVNLYVHTHDPQKKTTYYRWEYAETWQYRSAYNSVLGVKNHIIFFHDSTNQAYNCWTTNNSTEVLLASSKMLSSDVISYAPLTFIPGNTEKLDVRYSIIVRQYALTEDAYKYWDNIRTSTQQTGTIFDRQPSQLVGNIHSVTNPNEPVLGYITAGGVAEKRIFIDNAQLNSWVFVNYDYRENCGLVTVAQNATDYLRFNISDTTLSPYYFITPGLMAATKTRCVDCTWRGGTNEKPTYW